MNIASYPLAVGGGKYAVFAIASMGFWTQEEPESSRTTAVQPLLFDVIMEIVD